MIQSRTTKLRNLVFISLLGFFILGFTTTAWATFLPQKSVYANQSIYIEIPSAQKLTQQIKEFYMALRPDGGKTELQNMGEKLKDKLGFNILEPRELKEAGIDPTAPIFISLKQQTQNAELSKLSDTGSFFFHIYLPARDSKLLYKILIAGNKTTRVNPQTGELIEESKGKEIRADQVYVVPGKNDSAVFTVRGSDFVHITNNPNEIGDRNGLPPATLALGKDEFYQRSITAVSLNRSTIARLITSPTMYGTSQKQWMSLLKGENKEEEENLLTDYFLELKENLDFSVALIDMDKKALQANSRSAFKNNYLQKDDTALAQLLQKQSPSLPSDFVKNFPLAYFKFAVKPKMLSLIFDIIRDIAKEKDGIDIEQTVKEKMGVSIEQDVLPSFDGSAAILLQDMPPMSAFKNFDAWNFFVQFGLQENGSKKLEKVAEAFANSFNKEDNAKFVKAKSKGATLWSFINKDKNIARDIFLLDQKSLLVNPKPQLLKSLKKKTKSSLLNRMLKKNVEDEKYPFYFFVDMKQLNEYFSTEVEERKNGVILMILSYTQNMSFLSAYTKIEENEMRSRFSLDLK